MTKRYDSFILTAYLCLISAAFIDVYVSDKPVIVIGVTAVLAILFYLVLRLILPYIRSFYVVRISPSPTLRDKVKSFVITSLICFCAFFVWYLAFFPGTFTNDTVGQYQEAVSGRINNWHPALHTLLFFSFPLKLFCGHVWGIVLFQIILFSLCIGYLCTSVFSRFGTKPVLFIMLYILLNPNVCQIVICPIKDAAFAMGGLIAVTMLFNIYMDQTTDDPGYAWAKCILCGLSMACTAIFRHNGILFSGALIISILFIFGAKRCLVITATFVLSMILIKGPVYHALNVNTAGSSDVMQIAGLPMTVIGNVVVETPELLDEETAEFVYSIASLEEWNDKYVLGNFSYFRYNADANLTPVEEAGIPDILKMTGRCFVRSPKASLKAFLALTDIVYGVDVKDDGWFGFGAAEVTDPDEALTTTGIPWLANILIIYYKLVRLHGWGFIRQTAFALFATLTVMLAKSAGSDRQKWRPFLICLPVLTYNFGTMFFLATSDARFFFINYLVCPLLIIVMLMKSENTGAEGI